MPTTTDTATATDNIRIGVYDTAILRYVEPCWDALPDCAKLAVMRDLPTIEEISDHNTTCIALDELRADSLNDTTPTSDDTVTAVVVGDDDTAPEYEDRELGNQVAEVDVAEYETDGTDLIVNAVLGSEQANNTTNEIAELGLITGDEDLLNHATFSSFEKTNNRSVVLEVTLSFTNATS